MQPNIDQTLAECRSKISGNLALLAKCRQDMASTANDLLSVQNNRRYYAEATQILRDLYEQTQERFHGQIMQIVSYCLKEVFGDDAYEFKIEFSQKRSQVEAVLVFVRDGEVYDPLSATGGGVLAVAVFALRLAVIYLAKQATRPIMVLDEPFGQLSVEYREPMAILLEKLVDEFGFQFILITHAQEFQIGKIHRFS